MKKTVKKLNAVSVPELDYHVVEITPKGETIVGKHSLKKAYEVRDKFQSMTMVKHSKLRYAVREIQ